MSEIKKAAHHDRPNTDIPQDKGTKITGYEDEIDWGEELKKRRLYPTDEIEDEAVCIWIKDEINPIEFGTLGNISVISGKAKSKKSFTTNLIVAAALNDSTFDAGPFNVVLPENKKRVLVFDTEQGRRRGLKALNRICKMAGIETPSNLEFYNLRADSKDERLKLIIHGLNGGNPQKDIGLVIIDGGRDLLFDFNNPEESYDVVTKFMQWSEINMLHIVTIIHQNKGDNNARGHLGAELINKCETHISVEVDKKDKSISIVSPEHTRDVSFDPFAFQVNEHGLPALLPDYQISGNGDKSAGKKSFNPFEVQPESHHKILAEVFKDSNSIGYADLRRSLKIQWQALDIPISDNKIQELITYYKANRKWITHNGGNSKAAKYSYQSH
jgi:hypothetical protein